MANKLNFTTPKLLNHVSAMPQVSPASAGWARNITLGLVSQSITPDGDRQVSINWQDFFGTVQPLSIRSLSLKPEGQRSWKWLQIHVFNGSLNLSTGALIQYSNVQYKVMGVYDYSLNNYIEYHVVTDYLNGGD